MGARRSFLFVLQYIFLLSLPGIILVVSAADGNWSEWLDWSQCSATCGNGKRTRLRFCNNPAPSRDGRSCSGRSRERENCAAPINCAVDGQWSEWEIWTACSVTCGEGTRTRFRECDSPPPANDGRDCEGSPEETMRCVSSKDCPRDGKWSRWSRWSACSVTCGEGTTFRYRECNNPPPSPNGRDCQGERQQSNTCNVKRKCSVNGHWSEWSEWSACTVTCGSGARNRWRRCDNPPPQNGGEDCSRTEAGEMQDQSCNGSIVFCAVNGGWSDFSEWGDCFSPSCPPPNGMTYTIRQRSCSNPYPAHKGSMCQGTFLDVAGCDSPINCPVDGQWSQWGEWAVETCERGSVSRHRTCNNPAPLNGGKNCTGSNIDTYIPGDDEFEENCPGFVEDEDEDDGDNNEDGNDDGNEDDNEEDENEDDNEEDEND